MLDGRAKADAAFTAHLDLLQGLAAAGDLSSPTICAQAYLDVECTIDRLYRQHGADALVALTYFLGTSLADKTSQVAHLRNRDLVEEVAEEKRALLSLIGDDRPPSQLDQNSPAGS